MAFGTFEDTTWPVDTDDVEWRLRHAQQHVTDEDKRFAAAVMGAYRHLIDPIVEEKDARAALKRARTVATEIYANQQEALEEEVTKKWVVQIGNDVIGPFTLPEGREKALEYGGRLVNLKNV